MTPDALPWRRALGARPVGDGLAEFRVWAPRPDEVRLRVEDREHGLEHAGHGVYEARVPAAAGARYVYVLDGEAVPDPCTRSQPDGLRGPSRLVDPGAWTWSDERFGGVPLRDLVLYELHVGTFTPEGTFDAAIPHVAALRELGVTALELMPVAAGPGERGWGYDGVYPWAAHTAYGGPDGLQRLVDAAHAEGLAVILDLVLNHVGASGGARSPPSARTSPTATRRSGATPSTTTTPIRTRSASGRSRAPRRGCATSTWTASASTPSTPSTTPGPRTCSPSWPTAFVGRTRGRS